MEGQSESRPSKVQTALTDILSETIAAGEQSYSQRNRSSSWVDDLRDREVSNGVQSGGHAPGEAAAGSFSGCMQVAAVLQRNNSAVIMFGGCLTPTTMHSHSCQHGILCRRGGVGIRWCG